MKPSLDRWPISSDFPLSHTASKCHSKSLMPLMSLDHISAYHPRSQIIQKFPQLGRWTSFPPKDICHYGATKNFLLYIWSGSPQIKLLIVFLWGSREMAQQLRWNILVTKNLGLIPSTHIRQLVTTCNSSPGTKALCPMQELISKQCIGTHTYT